MRCHCGCGGRGRKRNKCVKVPLCRIGTPRKCERFDYWIIPFTSRFKEGQKSCKAIQVHNGTSKMVMKFTTLGVVHGRIERTATKRAKRV